MKFYELVRVYLMATVKKCLGTRDYFTFKGRASRTEFCYFFLFVTLCLIVASFVGSTLFWFVVLMLTSPAAAVCVRRLHDLNHSGWFAIISPFAGFFPLKYSFVYLCSQKSIEEDNAHGSKPLEIWSELDQDNKLRIGPKLSPLAAGGLSLGVLILTCFIILILMSLTASSGKSGPDEFSDYINETSRAVGKQEIIVRNKLKKLEDISDDDFNDDNIYYDLVESILEESSTLVEIVESAEPTDPKLEEVHQKLIKAVNKQQQALLTLMEGIDSDDFTVIANSHELFAQGRALMRDYRNSLEALAKEYDVEIKWRK